MPDETRATLLFLLGGFGVLFSLVHTGDAGRFGPDGTTIVILTMLVSLVLCGAGFVYFLKARDNTNKNLRPWHPHPPQESTRVSPEKTPTTVEPESRGVYALREGQKYRVIQSFVDYYQGAFDKGEELTFSHYNFLPYHGGYTLHFTPRAMYFQEEENAQILSRLEEYLEPIG